MYGKAVTLLKNRLAVEVSRDTQFQIRLAGIKADALSVLRWNSMN